jgi:acetyl esterase/lipase
VSPPAPAASGTGGAFDCRVWSRVANDEGEAYANKLRQAGVSVTAARYQGAIHDFVMLNALRGTNAAEAAITQASGVLRNALH